MFVSDIIFYYYICCYGWGGQRNMEIKLPEVYLLKTIKDNEMYIKNLITCLCLIFLLTQCKENPFMKTENILMLLLLQLLKTTQWKCIWATSWMKKKN